MTKTIGTNGTEEKIRIDFPRPSERWQFKGYLEWPIGSNHKAGTGWHHRLVPGFNVLRSLSTMEDGSKWVHVSVARPDRVPSWEELSKVKDDFIGKDREAYQILAKEKDHVNEHPNCLHLWHRVDGQAHMANLQLIANEESL